MNTLVRRVWESLDRAKCRRRLVLSLLVLATGLLTWFARRHGPSLSPLERALVGEWGHAETDPGLSFATLARGPLRSPWIVQEFGTDRTYRQWIVSAEDTTNHFVHVRGRWRVVGGVIRIEEQPIDMQQVVENTGRQIEQLTGLPLGSSNSYLHGTVDTPFRLLGSDDLELMFPNQNRPHWRRLLGSFQDHPRMLMKRDAADIPPGP